MPIVASRCANSTIPTPIVTTSVTVSISSIVQNATEPASTARCSVVIIRRQRSARPRMTYAVAPKARRSSMPDRRSFDETIQIRAGPALSFPRAHAERPQRHKQADGDDGARRHRQAQPPIGVEGDGDDPRQQQYVANNLHDEVRKEIPQLRHVAIHALHQLARRVLGMERQIQIQAMARQIRAQAIRGAPADPRGDGSRKHSQPLPDDGDDQKDHRDPDQIPQRAMRRRNINEMLHQ